MFVNEDEHDIVVMYHQFDGYVEGHGKELVDFLKGKKLVNGFSSSESKNYFNGMGCLSASTIAHFKTKIGGFYLQADSRPLEGGGVRNLFILFQLLMHPILI